MAIILLCVCIIIANSILYKSKSEKLKGNEKKIVNLEKELDSMDIEDLDNDEDTKDVEIENEKVDFSEKFVNILEKIKNLSDEDVLVTSIKADELKIVISGLAKDEPTIKIIEDYLKDYNPKIDYEKKDAYYFTITLEEK